MEKLPSDLQMNGLRRKDVAMKYPVGTPKFLSKNLHADTALQKLPESS
jgi:hypothetical protein